MAHHQEALMLPKGPANDGDRQPSGGFSSLVGGTPLVRINSLSELTGCEILAKCEFQGPGGSVKDRAAKYMVDGLERRGLITPGRSSLVEATAGNTGVALCLVGLQKGYRCVFCYPEYVAQEKLDVLRTLGAELIRCPAVPWSDPRHFQATAKRIATERQDHVYVGQFDNPDNALAHFETTGPEIWAQTGGKIDGFVAATGTGGTLAGSSRFLKAKASDCRIYTLDTPGQGVAFERDTTTNRGMVRERLDHEKTKGTVATEGIGSGKLYENVRLAAEYVDGVLIFDDASTVSCAHYLLQREGLFVGGSAAANVLGAYLLAKKLGPGKTVVTILCDGGQRNASKIFNDAWLEQNGFGRIKCGKPVDESFLTAALELNAM